MNPKLLQKTLSVIISILLVFGPAPKAFSLPQGQTVVRGSATFTEQDNTLNINQATPRAIINYNSFNIDTKETVNFIQPSSSSIALNRVVGVDPSAILGSLNANGQVFLINPNGILFSQGASINVHGLVASTLDITNDAFWNSTGNYKFLQDPAKALGSVTNLGVLAAKDGGYVVLASPTVENLGVIQANLGTIALGSGQGFTIALANDKLISFAVDEAVTEELLAYLNNKGTLKADSGTILIEAKVAEELVDAVVNNDGLIEANNLVQDKSGTIKLTSNKSITNAGTIRANAQDYTKAGDIEVVAGKTLTLASTSRIEAKGKDIESAGGKVYLYSYGDAKAFDGQTIDISGGSVSGDGGWGELSAKDTAYVSGKVIGDVADGYKKASFIIDPAEFYTGNFDAGAATTWWWATGNGYIDGTVTSTTGSFLFLADHTGMNTSWWDDGVGDIYLTNTGSVTTNSGNVWLMGANAYLDGTVHTTTGNIYIYARDNINTAANLIANSGQIDFYADYNNDNLGDFTMTGGNIHIASGSGNVRIYSDLVGTPPAAAQTVNLQGGVIEVNGTGGVHILADEGINLLGTNIISPQGYIYFLPNWDGYTEVNPTGGITMTAGTIQAGGAGQSFSSGSAEFINLSGGNVLGGPNTQLAFISDSDINLSGTNILSQHQVVFISGFATNIGGSITHTAGTIHGNEIYFLAGSGYFGILPAVNNISLLGGNIQGGSLINVFARDNVYINEPLNTTGADLHLETILGNITLGPTGNIRTDGGDFSVAAGSWFGLNGNFTMDKEASIATSGGNLSINLDLWFGTASITGIDTSGGNVFISAKQILDAGDDYPLDISVGTFDKATILSKVQLISSLTGGIPWPQGNMEPGAVWPGIGDSGTYGALEIFKNIPTLIDLEQEDNGRKNQRKMVGLTTTSQFKCTAIRLR